MYKFNKLNYILILHEINVFFLTFCTDNIDELGWCVKINYS